MENRINDKELEMVTGGLDNGQLVENNQSLIGCEIKNCQNEDSVSNVKPSSKTVETSYGGVCGANS